MRSSLFALTFLGACLSAPVCAQISGAPADQERPAEHVAENIANLLLEPVRRGELEEAIGRKNYQRAEQILVEESEREPKSARSAKLLTVAGGVFFLDGQYLDAIIAWERAEAIAPLDERNRFTLAMASLLAGAAGLRCAKLFGGCWKVTAGDRTRSDDDAGI